MIWGAILLSLPVTQPPQLVLSLALEVERGHTCRHSARPLVVVT